MVHTLDLIDVHYFLAYSSEPGMTPFPPWLIPPGTSSSSPPWESTGPWSNAEVGWSLRPHPSGPHPGRRRNGSERSGHASCVRMRPRAGRVEVGSERPAPPDRSWREPGTSNSGGARGAISTQRVRGCGFVTPFGVTAPATAAPLDAWTTVGRRRRDDAGRT